MRTRTLLRVVFLVALVVIFVFALAPAPDTAQVIDHQDKFEHLLVFLLLGLLGLAAWPQHPRSVIVALLSYGLLMELAQSFTEHRQGDPWDGLADALGVAGAWWITHLRARMRAQ